VSTQQKGNQGIFVVLEGLTGVGKSTFTWELANQLDMVIADVQFPEFKAAQQLVENDAEALEARHALFFSALCLAAKKVNELLREGQMVICDSWIFRTQATHLSMGSSLNFKVPAWFPQPDIKILLTCDEEQRNARIISRGTPSGYWKAQCESHSEEILAWYRKNIKGLAEVDSGREKDQVMTELLLKVRPTVRKRREFLQSKVKTENSIRKFLQADLIALEADIEHCQGLIKEAKEMGQEATEQSSESWHDNYNFEESQRLLKMHMNNLGRLSNAKEKAEVVVPGDTFDAVAVGAAVEFSIVGSERVEKVHIGSYLVGEENRAKGFMSYDAPRVAGLLGAKVGDTCKIQLDTGFTDVTITSISRSPLL
jgi:thymidylate kinase/transcription elongation GreA/GreB family factor